MTSLDNMIMLMEITTMLI